MKKDGEQIYIEESCSGVFGGNKISGSDLGIPEFQEELLRQKPAKQKCLWNCQTSWQRLSSQKHQTKL